MKPIDLRNALWAEIQGMLAGDRLLVHAILLRHGACTTRQLATVAEMDPFSVRPRVTELCQLGLAELVDKDGHEGVYQAVTIETAKGRHEEVQRGAEQLCLGLR